MTVSQKVPKARTNWPAKAKAITLVSNRPSATDGQDHDATVARIDKALAISQPQKLHHVNPGFDNAEPQNDRQPTGRGKREVPQQVKGPGPMNPSENMP